MRREGRITEARITKVGRAGMKLVTKIIELKHSRMPECSDVDLGARPLILLEFSST
jgi:hypothetical protein